MVIALITGICIGWFSQARYWGMPLLKIVGPIPATAWVPLAMVISPSMAFSAVALIALAVWFPVTMLTASGISNTRASYLDVARTLGAGRRYSMARLQIVLAALVPAFVVAGCSDQLSTAGQHITCTTDPGTEVILRCEPGDGTGDNIAGVVPAASWPRPGNEDREGRQHWSGFGHGHAGRGGECEGGACMGGRKR